MEWDNPKTWPILVLKGDSLTFFELDFLSGIMLQLGARYSIIEARGTRTKNFPEDVRLQIHVCHAIGFMNYSRIHANRTQLRTGGTHFF